MGIIVDLLRSFAYKATHRHKKRGTLYVVLGEATLQATTPPLDDTPMIVYTDQSGRLWVRPVHEFNDGRFEELE